jgi:VTC domain
MFLGILQAFQTFSLFELDSTNLLMKNRFESKYYFNLSQLDSILEACQNRYNILKIDDRLIFDYQNVYFDTKDYQLYYHHHNGKAERYKIRKRVYLNSQLSFIEVKQKTKKGNTNKYREEGVSIENAASFLKSHISLDCTQLIPTLENKYKRITLLHKKNEEKVTIDINLNFASEKNNIAFNQIAIAEVKSESYSGTDFSKIMKLFGIREGWMSKYCMGMIALGIPVRHNLFNQSYNQILKKNTDGTK